MRLISLRDITSIKPFDCGDADLNEFLLADAKFYEDQPTIPMYFDLKAI